MFARDILATKSKGPCANVFKAVTGLNEKCLSLTAATFSFYSDASERSHYHDGPLGTPGSKGSRRPYDGNRNVWNAPDCTCWLFAPLNVSAVEKGFL